MTRKSKIARLPRPIREELNHRLDNGHSGVRLVEWLNSLPEVQEILAREFQGRRITPQNLSEWRAGGYQDWLAHQEQQATLQDFLADAKQMGQEFNFGELAENLCTFVTAHFAVAVHKSAYRPENHRNLDFWSRMVRESVRLRQCELARDRLELAAEKFEFQTELAARRLELDRARLEIALQRVDLDRQETRMAVNLEEVPALSPGLRHVPPKLPSEGGRDAGRYPGGASEIVPNPERIVSEAAQDPRASTSPSVLSKNTQHATRNTEYVARTQDNPAETATKHSLIINDLQPNPTKSNNHFFIFPGPSIVGHITAQLQTASASFPSLPSDTHRDHEPDPGAIFSPSPPRSGGEGRGEVVPRAQGETALDVGCSMFVVGCSSGSWKNFPQEKVRFAAPNLANNPPTRPEIVKSVPPPARDSRLAAAA